MTAIKLITHLRARGVVLKAQGNILHIDAPRGVLTDALCEKLRVYKLEILAMVRLDVVLPMLAEQTTGDITQCDHCQMSVFVGQMFCDNCGAYFHQ
jgi:hypothetical protein